MYRTIKIVCLAFLFLNLHSFCVLNPGKNGIPVCIHDKQNQKLKIKVEWYFLQNSFGVLYYLTVLVYTKILKPHLKIKVEWYFLQNSFGVLYYLTVLVYTKILKPQGWWLAVDIYLAALRLSKCPPLTTSSSLNSC